MPGSGTPGPVNVKGGNPRPQGQGDSEEPPRLPGNCPGSLSPSCCILGRASYLSRAPWHLRANPWSLPSGSPGPCTPPDRAHATRQRRCAPAPGVAFEFSLALRPWIARYDVYGSPASSIRRATLRPKTSNQARPDWQELASRSLPGLPPSARCPCRGVSPTLAAPASCRQESPAGLSPDQGARHALFDSSTLSLFDSLRP